ncbi:hypothetical protein LF844_25040 [Metapseudomonas lalkuanensis]|uniref:DUF6966 domain-containing protein n=1 Tax=Metapseudomonas lalkuanensis TaxID=2604832 RepID=UPI001CF2C5A0|nr:hypothetical protein [Pseudomonas lalkuanensis]UCO97882.1 hypothetical protein LF844_25040 [Pseudomonas lalkuanensis]
MNKINEIDAVLKRMIELLRFVEFEDWAVALEKVKMDFGCNEKLRSSELLSMYGGMGSLNDVVLYKGGQPLVAENNEFDRLRVQLYELCKM